MAFEPDPPSAAANPSAGGPPCERPIRFLHRGGVVEVACDRPTRTVLEWLREDARRTGTKEGCNEGDCGACMVVVGRLDDDDRLQLEPINACIRFLPALDGKALYTVEDLAAPDGTLHPVQQALLDFHGSQCGFCTPGFVMTLWAVHEQHAAAGTVPSRQQLADDLAGNLCRCTGYRPILDAGQSLFSGAGAGETAGVSADENADAGFDAGVAPAASTITPRLDRAPVVAALRALRDDPPLSAEGRFHAPRTLAALAALRQAKPAARLLAGSTDIGLWVTKQLRDVGELIATGEVAELRRVEVGADRIRIGAAAALEPAWQELVAEWPSLRDIWLRFASVPIRRAGTLGGNLANGSPIGDSAPVLMALGASVVLRRGERTRTLPLDDFYLGYLQNALEAGEFVEAVEVPRRGSRPQTVRAYKIAKRYDSDISAVCGAFAVECTEGRITAARLAFGGMAAVVRRARGAESALLGERWDEATLQAATAALAHDFEPLSDMRASSGYRLQVAQNLLRRLWLESRADAPLPPAALSVWARDADTGAFA